LAAQRLRVRFQNAYGGEAVDGLGDGIDGPEQQKVSKDVQRQQRLLPLHPPSLLDPRPQHHGGIDQDGAALATVVRQLIHGQPEVPRVRLRGGQLGDPPAHAAAPLDAIISGKVGLRPDLTARLTNGGKGEVLSIHAMVIRREGEEGGILRHREAEPRFRQTRLHERVERLGSKKVLDEVVHARAGGVSVRGANPSELFLVGDGRRARRGLGEVGPYVAEEGGEEGGEGDARVGLRLLVGVSLLVGVISLSHQFAEAGVEFALFVVLVVVVVPVVAAAAAGPFRTLPPRVEVALRSSGALALQILEPLPDGLGGGLLSLGGRHPELLLHGALPKNLPVGLEDLGEILIEHVGHGDDAGGGRVHVVDVASREVGHGAHGIGNVVKEWLVALWIVQIEEHDLANLGTEGRLILCGDGPCSTPIRYAEGDCNSDTSPGGRTGTNTDGGGSNPCPIMAAAPYDTEDSVAKLVLVKMMRFLERRALRS